MTVALRDELAAGGGLLESDAPPPPQAVSSRETIAGISRGCRVITRFQLDVSAIKPGYPTEAPSALLRPDTRLSEERII